MNRAARVAAFLAGALFLAGTNVLAQVAIEPVRGCFGHVFVDYATGVTSSIAPRVDLVTADVYDNLESPGNFGVVSSDANAVWGDSLTITQKGVVESITISVLNANDNGTPLESATFQVTLLDAATHLDLADLVFGATFTSGLAPGFYALVSITGLGGAVIPITVNTYQLVIQQKVLSASGPTRLGVVSLTPPTIGSSPASMYVAAVGAFGGVPGFYTFATGPANPGCDLKFNVVVPVTPMSWGRVKQLYR
jgi:hypothetical protein